MKNIGKIIIAFIVAAMVSGCVIEDRGYCGNAKLVVVNTSGHAITININSDYCNKYLYDGEDITFDLDAMYLDDDPVTRIYINDNGTIGYANDHIDVIQTDCYQTVYTN